MAWVDLHMHTTASDGLYSPNEVVQMGYKLGLAAVAITDHDTVAGIEEAQFASEKLPMEVIPGVEISTREQGKEIHVLGYFIDPQDHSFTTFLSRQRNVRQRRNEMVIEKLRSLGISITMDEVLHKQKSKTGPINVGRPHIAEVLVDKGIVHSMDEAFEKYLGEGGMAYCTPPRVTPAEAIKRIREAGGVPVLAHPGLYGDDQLVEKIIQEGLAGLEVYHPDHTQKMEQNYLQLAKKHNLIITGGSDFHGEREGVMYHGPIGSRRVAYHQLQELKNAIPL